MKASEKQSELSLFYRGHYCSWDELYLNIQDPVFLKTINPSGSLTTQTQDVFATTLYLLYGFIEKRTVFPVSTDFNYEQVDINYSDVALGIATSGTQAEPKIALISYQNIEFHCQHFVKIIPVAPSSIWLNCMPLNHIAGVMIIYRCWFNNALMVLHENFNTEEVWRDIN